MKAFTLISILFAITAFGSDRDNLLGEVKEKGKALHVIVTELKDSHQKHPKHFKFRGSDQQKQAAYNAQLKRHNEWMAKYTPAARDLEVFVDAYGELLICSDSRARDMRIELSAVLDGSKATPVADIDGQYGNWVIKDGTVSNVVLADDETFKWNPVNDVVRFQLPGGSAKGEWRRMKIVDGIMHYGTTKKWTQKYPKKEAVSNQASTRSKAVNQIVSSFRR